MSLEQLHDVDAIQNRPERQLARPPQTDTNGGKPDRIYTDWELVQMSRFLYRGLGSTNPDWQIKCELFLIAWGTGMRIGELCREKVTTAEGKEKSIWLQDCFLEEVHEHKRYSAPYIYLRHPEKTDYPRGIRIAPWAQLCFVKRVKRLQDKKRKYLFALISKIGRETPISKKTGSEWIKQVIEAAGLRLLKNHKGGKQSRPVHHATRTTMASWLAQLYREGHPWGIPLVDLQAQLGHKPGSDTAEEYYLRAIEERIFNRRTPPQWTIEICKAQGFNPPTTSHLYGKLADDGPH